MHEIMKAFERLIDTVSWEDEYPNYEQDIKTIRTALTQAAEIERGDKVVVDREPTDAMMKAGWEHVAPHDRAVPAMIYKAMITASEGK